MYIDRDKRKKIYKYHVAQGYTETSWDAWNKWFRRQDIEYQETAWEARERDVSFTGFNLTATPVCPYGNEDCTECGTGIYNKKKQETDMRANYMTAAPAAYATVQAAAAAPSETSVQRDFLRSRLMDAYYKKCDTESKPFGLVDDEAPKTIKERNERFAEGKYIIKWRSDEDDYDEDTEISSYAVGGTIRWRDPAVKEDKKGYKAAMEKLEQDLKDTQAFIVIKDVDTGLEALKAFESKTYH